MGISQTVGCRAFVEGIDEEKDDQQHQGDTCADQSCLREVGFLTGYLGLLALGVVDGSQLSGSAILLACDG